MDNSKPPLYTNPKVVEKKFNQQLAKYQKKKEYYNKLGILELDRGLNSISFAFFIIHLKPCPIAFSIRMDYSNWDSDPPSIKFINPFTKEILSKRDDIAFKLTQAIKHPVIPFQIQVIDLIQGIGEMTPFICIPGIKEYHDHPAHSGDPWMLHRTKGEGELCTLLDQLYIQMKSQNVNYSIQLNISGFDIKAILK